MICEKADEEYYLRKALAIMDARIANRTRIKSPEEVRTYLLLKMQSYEREVFGVLYLNTRHDIIHQEDIFFGTLDSCTVHPREVVRGALKRNASAVIAYHNHPSGDPEPSTADNNLTTRLKSALDMLDIRLLDHIVCGSGSSVSYAERGLL